MTTKERPVWFELLAGGASGGAAKTATAPMQRLVILQQVQKVSEKRMFRALKGVVERQGVLSLWRGNLVTVVHRFPYSGMSFTLYEWCKQFIEKRGGLTGNKVADRGLAGCIAGGGAVALTYPLDTIRTHLAVGSGTKAGSICREIISTMGYQGLFKGLSVSVLQKVPEVALQMCVYETSKDYLDTTSLSDYPNLKIFASATIAGVSSLLVYPADVVRRNIQLSTSKKSTFTVASNLIKENGFISLFSGGKAELARTLPFVMIMWFTLETIRDLGDRGLRVKAEL
eukprot:TRINITY_DN10424_c1_g1_i1.p1 TRINITY_DN10424_c1_g1~~TRINITY_DN10424_c1_g1_i1.p1  ORF type:complete len:285 (+),score=55.59 TRINITY_DN10424_c1_g1_i1:735-1589(+)